MNPHKDESGMIVVIAGVLLLAGALALLCWEIQYFAIASFIGIAGW